MACYVDTSVWVALLGHEATAPRVSAWMQRGMRLMTSAWTQVELASALTIKARRGEVTPAFVQQSCSAFSALAAQGDLRIAGCVDTDFAEAAAICRQVASGMRAGDALHVAVAQRAGGTHFLSFDHTLNRQALAMGLELIDLNP